MSGINNVPPPKSGSGPKRPAQSAPAQTEASQRAARRAEALRANLKRRKEGGEKD